jgi:hypothetical protein
VTITTGTVTVTSTSRPAVTRGRIINFLCTLDHEHVQFQDKDAMEFERGGGNDGIYSHVI